LIFASPFFAQFFYSPSLFLYSLTVYSLFCFIPASHGFHIPAKLLCRINQKMYPLGSLLENVKVKVMGKKPEMEFSVNSDQDIVQSFSKSPQQH
jgi:hypothetical protein